MNDGMSNGAFAQWGRVAYRGRRIIPVILIALIALGHLLFGAHLGDRLSQEGWEDPRADSTTAAVIEQETFGRDNSGDVIVLVSAADVNDPAVFNSANEQISALKDRPEVAGIRSYFATPNAALMTPDGTKAFASIGLSGDGEQTLKDFRSLLPELEAIEIPGAEVQIAGATAVADALDKGMANDIARAEKVGLVFVAIILLFVFGGVIAAAMPLIVGILSIIGSLSLLAVLAQFQQVNIFSQSIITLLGLGLAIDYGLFMVSRFREELDKGRTTEEAVIETTATAGKTVFFSALMVGVALSGLFMFPQAFLKSVAYGAISAVLLAAIISVTVLPAMFGMLGPKIDKWAVRRNNTKPHRLWTSMPSWAMRHAKSTTTGVTALLLLITVPIVTITFGGINESYLPPQQETRQAQDAFNEAFPAYRTDPVKLVISGADNQQLGAIMQQARQVEGFATPLAPSRPTTDGVNVLSAPLADRNGGQEVIDQLRAIDTPEGVDVYIAGTPAMEVESIEALLERLPWMALYMILATFLLMAIVFRSMILPAKAVIMNVLGIGATLGFLTLVFVQGVGSGLLNFTPGPLMSPVLVLIISILYGLSTDYEVFLVSRMVEARHKGADTDTAIKDGTAHTGGIITAAAAIMIVVAAAFAASDIVMMKYIAYGMIFSLALDATIIRLLLVPAVMHLLGEDNWWMFGKASASKSSRPEGEIPIEETVVDTQPYRSGVSVDEDSQLVPFSQLMRDLQERER